MNQSGVTLLSSSGPTTSVGSHAQRNGDGSGMGGATYLTSAAANAVTSSPHCFSVMRTRLRCLVSAWDNSPRVRDLGATGS